MANSYLDLDGFKSRSIIPSADIDQLESLETGWLQFKLDERSSWLDSQLAKRYAVPFGDLGNPRTNVPPMILAWLTALVTLDAYDKRGWNPSVAQADRVIARAEKSESEIALAANSVSGLYELPLRADSDESAVTRGSPLAYSEASPYRWMSVQRDAVLDEEP